LEPLRDQLPEEVFTTPFRVPKTDGSGNNRANLREALKLLRGAGFRLVDGVMTNADGLALTFEILLVSPASERIALPFVDNLERIGVTATVRTVDVVQYQNRMRDFDFDMTTGVFGQSLSPGNEQRDYWGSAAAVRPGSRNLIGIQSPAIDALVDAVIQAEDREALITVTRALDRVLLWGHYLVPHFHSRADRLIYWNRFGRPDEKPKYGAGFLDTWWIDPQKDAAVRDWRKTKR
jgi:microcin C transport system substrate-binding protein